MLKGVHINNETTANERLCSFGLYVIYCNLLFIWFMTLYPTTKVHDGEHIQLHVWWYRGILNKMFVIMSPSEPKRLLRGWITVVVDTHPSVKEAAEDLLLLERRQWELDIFHSCQPYNPTFSLRQRLLRRSIIQSLSYVL